MSLRTIDAICLGPRGSIQGGYNCISLSTGERIHRNKWTSLPIPKDVIDRVHKLATTSPTEIAFEDKHGNITEDESDSHRDMIWISLEQLLSPAMKIITLKIQWKKEII
jgi:hypothetical protein